MSQIYQIRLLGLDEVDEVVDLFQVWPDDVKQVDQLPDLNLLLLQLSLAILIAFLKWKKSLNTVYQTESEFNYRKF